MTASIYYASSQDYSLNASKNEVEIGERFKVQLTIENFEPTQLKLPDFNPFRVISGPQESKSMTIINGKRSFSRSITYILESTQSGEFHIGAATMMYKAQKLSTNSLKIKVVKSSNKVIPNLNSQSETMIRLEIPTGNYYVGQQIALNVVMYTRQNIARYEIIDALKFPGFYMIQTPNINELPREEKINGKEYYRQVLQKILLFPQKSGVFDYEPIRCKIAISDDNRLGMFFGEVKYDQIQSNPLQIKVKSLPEPLPNTFTGAVGDFELIDVSLSKNTIAVGESFQIQMSIKGDGDPKVVQIPIVKPIQNLESYPASVIKDETNFINDKQISTKTFEYTFVPKKDTTIKILPEFTYFNPEKNTYETLSRDSLTVSIVPVGSTNTQNNASKGNLIVSDTTQKVFSQKPLLGSKIWYFILSGLLLFTLFGLFIKSKYIKNSNLKWAETQTPEYKVRQHLEKAKSCLDQSNTAIFYEELFKAVQDFILQKFNIPVAQSNLGEVEKALIKNGISTETIQSYTTLVNKINEARFAGKSENAASLYENGIVLLKKLDAGI
ncbi:MAG: BatD family protein [Saprospiraceae bacterium]